MKKVLAALCSIIILAGIGVFSMYKSGAISYEVTDSIKYVSDSATQFTVSQGMCQDSNLAIARDKNGVLWGVFGHTSEMLVTTKGYKFTVWKGTKTDDLVKQPYDATLNFRVGPAGTSFNSIPYPSGVLSRGAIWMVGLYIDDNGQFWGYIHNETGWHTGNNSGYTISAKSDDNAGEPDYRTMGLITSKDQGRNWSFVDWVVSAEANPYSDLFQPDGNNLPNAQKGPIYCLGAGDACIFVNDNDGYIYMYYSMIYCEKDSGIYPEKGGRDEIYVARAPKSDPSHFTKYYNGSFSQPGKGGKETALLSGKTAIPTVAYSTYLNKYIMFTYDRFVWNGRESNPIPPVQYSFSTDLVKWTTPIKIEAAAKKELGEPYWSVFNNTASGNVKYIGKTFYLYHNMFANDVKKMTVTTSEPKAASSSSKESSASSSSKAVSTSTVTSVTSASSEVDNSSKETLSSLLSGSSDVFSSIPPKDAPKSNWLLPIIIGLIVLLGGGGTALFIIMKKKQSV